MRSIIFFYTKYFFYATLYFRQSFEVKYFRSVNEKHDANKTTFFSVMIGALLLSFVLTYLTPTPETPLTSAQLDTTLAPELAQLSAEAKHQVQQVHYRQIIDNGYGHVPAIDLTQANPQLGNARCVGAFIPLLCLLNPLACFS